MEFSFATSLFRSIVTLFLFFPFFSHEQKSLLNRAIHRQIPDMDVFFLNINVRRSHLLSDSLLEISRKQLDLKKKLKVTFVGEPGLDMGGLTKEWFLLLIKEIFDSDYGMFVYHKQSRCYWFSTTQAGNNLREYNLIGVLTGLAVYNSIILDLHFPTACYKKLLSPPVVPSDLDSSDVGTAQTTMDDFAEVMPDVAVGLKQLLAYEGSVEEDFCMTFQVMLLLSLIHTYSEREEQCLKITQPFTHESCSLPSLIQVSVEEFGEVKTHVLKPGGDNIPVTNESRKGLIPLELSFRRFSSLLLLFA